MSDEVLWTPPIPEKGKWLGTPVLPRRADEIWRARVDSAKRSVGMIRKETQRVQPTEDLQRRLVDLEKRSKSALARLTRAVHRIEDKEFMANDPYWCSIVDPSEVREARDNVTMNIGRAVQALEDLCRIFMEFRKWKTEAVVSVGS